MQENPRLAPTTEENWDAETRGIVTAGGRLNVFATLAHHPKLLKRWLVFGNHVLAKSTLGPRERELAILRVGWNCRAEYEWAQHVAIARDCGVTDEEIERVAGGPQAAGWDERDQALLRATDELHADHFVTDATWQALARHYDTQQLMDFVFTVGQYTLVSMALNTLGVQLEEGAARFPQRG